jgi:hypothetical protein
VIVLARAMGFFSGTNENAQWFVVLSVAGKDEHEEAEDKSKFKFHGIIEQWLQGNVPVTVDSPTKISAETVSADRRFTNAEDLHTLKSGRIAWQDFMLRYCYPNRSRCSHHLFD